MGATKYKVTQQNLAQFYTQLSNGIVWFRFDRRIVPSRLSREEKWAREPAQGIRYVGHYGNPYRRMMGTLNRTVENIVDKLVSGNAPIIPSPIFSSGHKRRSDESSIKYEPNQYNLEQVFDVLCTEYRCIPLPQNTQISPPYRKMPTHYSNAQRKHVVETAKLVTSKMSRAELAQHMKSYDAESGGGMLFPRIPGLWPTPPDGDIVVLDYLPLDKDFADKLQMCVRGLTKNEMINWMENMNIDYPRIYPSSISEKELAKFQLNMSSRMVGDRKVKKENPFAKQKTPNTIAAVRQQILNPQPVMPYQSSTDGIHDVDVVEHDDWIEMIHNEVFTHQDEYEYKQHLKDSYGDSPSNINDVPEDYDPNASIHDPDAIQNQREIEKMREEILKDLKNGQEYK